MRFVKESIIRASPERVFAFHELPDVFERLIPPWENVTVIQMAAISVVGSQAILEANIFGPFKTRWVAEHTIYDPPHLFEDIQVSGPFKSWRHRHIIEPHSDGAVLRDDIEYETPFSIFGSIADTFGIVPKLEKMFDHRHEVTRQWCENED